MRFTRKEAQVALKKRLKKIHFQKKSLISRRSTKKYFLQKNKKIFYLLGIFLLFLGTIYFLFFSSVFEIRKIEISQLKEISKNDIQRETEDFLKEKSFFFFPKNNFFLFKKEKLEQRLLKKFPKIEKIEIKKNFFSTLILTIEEKRPLAVLFSKEKEYFLLIERGTVLSEIPEEDLKKYEELPLIEGETSLVPISLVVLNFIKEVYQEFPKKFPEIKITSVYFLDPSFYKISFKTSKGCEIYFNLVDQRSVEQRIDLLKEFLEKENLSLENSKYIDISVEDRIYWKK